MKQLCLLLLFLVPFCVKGQYAFSGHINKDSNEGTIYLSVVKNYRQLSGVYPEQILDKTTANEDGEFLFKGNNLPLENKMYRIHIDTCSDEEALENHFTGHCLNSQEVLFIANNNSKVSLPFSFENEMFCSVISTNKNADAFLKIDSLKADMRFAFSTYRSEANRELNSKKWFATFQEYGESLNEPLAELYSYAFLSDRTSNLYGYYLEDIKSNPYYTQLLTRLQDKYPTSEYTTQFKTELQADGVLNTTEKSSTPWLFIILAFLVLSILANILLLIKNKKLQSNAVTLQPLSGQETKIASLIAENKSNKEIADILFISVSTVKTHINNIYKKTNVSSRSHLKSIVNKNSTGV